jgi:AraC-like DNA-binding protein
MAQISIATVRALINFLSDPSYLLDRQVDTNSRTQLLDVANLTESQLTHSSLLIDSAKYEALFTYAEQTFQLNTLGFDFGKTISADRWGILGYIAYTSPTLKVALAKQRKFQSLAGSIGIPISETVCENLLLKWIPAYQCSHHIVEEIITGWATLASNLSQSKIKPRSIYFQHYCQGNNIQKYVEYFACPVHFGHDFNGIEIEQASLDIPLSAADKSINEVLCEQANRMLCDIIEQSPIESVNQYIINQLPLGVPEIDEAANQLGLSVRTLQRKLSDNEKTFTSMIDNIRKDLALSYLKNTNTKIIYIAQMLGFSEQSAFQRAFKRWTGHTPKQYREKCKAD